MPKEALSENTLNNLKESWLSTFQKEACEFFKHLPPILCYEASPADKYSGDTSCNWLLTQLNDSFDTVLNQVFSELFLNYVNLIAASCAETIQGVDNFINQLDSLPDKNSTTDKKFFSRYADHLVPCYPDYAQTEHFLSALKKDSAPEITTLHTNLVTSDRVLSDTALERYFQKHIHYNAINRNARSRFTFCSASRFFLSSILKNTSGGTVPYTVNALNGFSVKSMNNFFIRMYKNQPSIEEDALEALLFFHNLEEIFSPSLISDIFSTCKEKFSLDNRLWVEQYVCSIRLLNFLKDCPLNSLKHFVWKNHEEVFTQFQVLDDRIAFAIENEYRSEVLFITQVLNPLCLMLKRTFTDILDKHYGVHSNTLDNLNPDDKTALWHYFSQDIMPLLKKLPGTSCFDFSWSKQNFLNPEKTYHPLPSIFDEYFDFYLLLYFYSPQAFPETFDRMIYAPWHDFYDATATQCNSFLTYLLTTKRPSNK